jgi:surfeit locus 1 family protein
VSKIILKHWPRHLLILLALIVLVNLGQWQLSRLEQRRDYNRQISAGLNQPPVELAGEPVDPAELNFRRVTVTGHFNNDESLLLRNRSYQGRPGAHLIVPLQIAGSDRTVLVDRGWIPLDSSDLPARRAYDLEGQVTITGVARQSQTRPDTFLAPTDPEPKPGENGLDAWFRIDIDRIQAQISAPLLPVFIEQSPSSEVVAATPPIPEENLDLGEGSHLGYAIQWFTFALILAVVYTTFTWQEYRKG